MRYASLLWVLAVLVLVARMRWTTALLYALAVVVGLELLANILGVRLSRGVIPLLR